MKPRHRRGIEFIGITSDHFVYPEERFLETMLRAVRTAERLENRLVLLGALPDNPELEYGWIWLGRELGVTHGHPVRSVRSFLEKPGLEAARAAMTSGALWNTMVVAARAETLWAMGWRYLPDMMPLFESFWEAIGSPEEGAVLDSVYRAMPARDFSSELLQRARGNLAVVELGAVLWSDWGRPERITETLRQIGKYPAFARAQPANGGREERTQAPAPLERESSPVFRGAAETLSRKPSEGAGI